MTAALLAVADGKSLWYLTRGSGIVTQLLLTASLVGGILTTFEWTPAAMARFVVPRLHRNVSLLVVVFLVLHVATTVLDGYARVGWLDAIIPLRSAYKPMWVGLGAVAVDLLIAVIITSLLRARLGRRTWRAVHWLSYASWPIAMIHGYGIGSDTSTRWMLAINVACVVLATGFCLWRVAAPPRGGARLGDAPIGAGAASRSLAAARHRNPGRSPARSRGGAGPRAAGVTTPHTTATASAGSGARNRDRR